MTKTSMTCEQIQSLWASEPEVLSLVDTRPRERFDAHHLPGSVHVDLENLRSFVNQLEDKLAVILCEPDQQDAVHGRLRGKENYVLLEGCQRWLDSTAPRPAAAGASPSEVPEILVEDVRARQDRLLLVDVRRDDEFNNELGHVEGARLVTLGPELTRFLASAPRDREMVFICRSGKRSETATLEARRAGFANVANMVGGMLLWNERNFPVVRSS